MKMGNRDLYEYKVVKIKWNNMSVIEDTLNKLGSEGWELIAIIPRLGDTPNIYHLKRKKN